MILATEKTQKNKIEKTQQSRKLSEMKEKVGEFLIKCRGVKCSQLQDKVLTLLGEEIYMLVIDIDT